MYRNEQYGGLFGSRHAGHHAGQAQDKSCSDDTSRARNNVAPGAAHTSKDSGKNIAQPYASVRVYSPIEGRSLVAGLVSLVEGVENARTSTSYGVADMHSLITLAVLLGLMGLVAWKKT